MFDFRYHIVSLVAVFLALAIGIMVGSSIENSGVLKEQQKNLVQGIKDDIDAIKLKNSNLQNQLQSQKAFEAEVLPALTKDKLKNKKVAVIYFKDTGSNTLKAASLETLQQAGAQVQEISLDRALLKKITVQTEPVTPDAKKPNNIERLAQELATAPGPLLEKIKKEMKISINNDLIPINSAVIFVGGDKPIEEEKELAKLLSRNKVKTVFVDKSDNKFSKIENFIDINIDTVDNVDMVYGRISLVYLLLDSRHGHFGIKSSAEQLIPVLN